MSLVKKCFVIILEKEKFVNTCGIFQRHGGACLCGGTSGGDAAVRCAFLNLFQSRALTGAFFVGSCTQAGFDALFKGNQAFLKKDAENDRDHHGNEEA
ncbi:MAG: hypothetical protein IJU56_05275 [Clostridia bacterium]|nr:hypothetical protein [Clostridia bacterium]